MKITLAVFLHLLVVLSRNSQAQTVDRYLVSIPLNEQFDRETVEALQLPIYYSFDNALIAGVPTERVDALQGSTIPYTILDTAPWSQRYYIVSSRKGRHAGSPFGNGKILFQDERTALVKVSSIEDLRLAPPEYCGVELKKVPHQFRNEKIVLTPHHITTDDSTISRIVAAINQDSVRSIVQSLQDFGTRFMLTQRRHSVAVWIQNRFISLGFTDVAIDSFDCLTHWNRDTITVQKNVIATLRGMRDPNRVFIAGGHADSYSTGNISVVAPGADDNASGTAAVLEMARVMKVTGYQPKSTIKFVAFGAEELMLYGDAGCRHFASEARNTGMNIELMINHDMISHSTARAAESSVDINYYSGHEYLLDYARQFAQRFSVVTPLTGTRNQASDSYPFWEQGFPAICFEERQFSPYYHTPFDIISNYNMEYCTEIIKASCALLVGSSSSPARIRNLTVTDAGTGGTLLLKWSRSATADVKGYAVHLGRSSASYDTSFFTSETTFVVKNLSDGTRYFIGIAVVDLDGTRSLILERSGVPYSKPLPPSNVYAEPLWHGVILRWNPNTEFDLLGYNIYRSRSPDGELSKLNSVVLRDTSYTDNPAPGDAYSFYSVVALDSTLQQSVASQVRSRPVTLDQGLLLVDETKGGDGSPLKPTDAQVDSFYHRLVSGYRVQDFDVETQGPALLPDLGAFSTVIWHGNDPSDFSAAVTSSAEISKYLRFGGRLCISSYRPTAAFGNNFTSSYDFTPGSAVYDDLKISHAENKLLARFYGAVPLSSGYPPLTVDTTKTTQALAYHLLSIEGIKAAPGATEIYRYDTIYDTSRVEGRMKGQPVGIEYMGSDYKLVVLSFPLYFMNFDGARDLVRFVISSKFSEPMTVRQHASVAPAAFELSQNYPNPFNPSTTIRFSLPIRSVVTLKVFDILGKEVVSLFSGGLPQGGYATTWDAASCASGVYFYRLTAGSFAQTRKLMIVR